MRRWAGTAGSGLVSFELLKDKAEVLERFRQLNIVVYFIAPGLCRFPSLYVNLHVLSVELVPLIWSILKNLVSSFLHFFIVIG